MSSTLRSTLDLLFGFSQQVTRRTYIVTGILLTIVKYSLDAGLVWAMTKTFWTPLSYIMPLMTFRERALGPTSDSTLILLIMGIYSLPFLWIGLTMSVRRATDAGKTPWLGIMFLIPGLNWLMMLILSLLPSKAKWEWKAPEVMPLQLKVAMVAIALGIGQSVAMVLLNVHLFGNYGNVLFFLTPCFVGLMAGYLTNMKQMASVGATLGTTLLTILLSGLSVLLFALEGVICLAMAMPLAIAAGSIGALVGRVIAYLLHNRKKGTHQPGAVLLTLGLLLPLLTGAEALQPENTPLNKVTTTVVINAPVDRVWHEVVYFSELPPAPKWVTMVGIAYPMRAKLVGQGVGAVRYCEFSTGPFVEPITSWKPGEHLGFDVQSQPMPMHEWSPYKKVHPPHLDGYWRSKRGEFRLTALPGGKTRLEGTTWYELEMGPLMYWKLIANGVVHGIHHRVLDHVKKEAEKPA